MFRENNGFCVFQNSKTTIVSFLMSLILLSLCQKSCAQYQELSLPHNTAVTGISFFEYTHGIATTMDSILYLINVKENFEINIIEDTLAHPSGFPVSTHCPFWVNNSIAGLIQTSYSTIGGHELLLSYNKGKSWEPQFWISDHFFIRDIEVKDDSVLYMAITSDIVNSIEILKINHFNKTGYPWYDNLRYLEGWFYPEILLREPDKLIISSYNDSLYLYDYANDTLARYKTNIENTPYHTLFYELKKGVQNKIIGVRDDGIYAAFEDISHWTKILHGYGFSELKHLDEGEWWVMKSSGNNRSLWHSENNGITWYSVFDIENKYSILEVVEPHWFWLANPNVSGQLAYGQYNPVSVPLQPLCFKTQDYLQVYPNPFNQNVTIYYGLPKPAKVELKFLNINGQLVYAMSRKVSYAGDFRVIWNGTDMAGNFLSSGLYFITLLVDGQTKLTQNILLLR